MTQLRLAEVLQRVDARKAELDAHRPLAPATVASLRDKLALDWTYNSNAIEGNTLTLRETKVVLEDGITIGKKSMREHFEAINHRDAILLVEELVRGETPINQWNLKNIHSLVLKNIDNEHAGRYRTGNVAITGAGFIPPSHLHLDQKMADLVEWYEGEARSLHPIDRAAQLHTRFVEIHPFEDGNGRTARLLLNFELMREGYPIAIIRSEDRLAYYDALDKACVQRDYSDFTRMVADCVARSQDLYLEVVTGIKPVPLDLGDSVPQASLAALRPGNLGDKHAYKQALAPVAPAWTAEQDRRAASLETIKGMATGALLTFAEIGAEAVQQSGRAASVNWRAVEDLAIAKAISEDHQTGEDVYRAIAGASPAACSDEHRAALWERVSTVELALNEVDVTPATAQRALETLVNGYITTERAHGIVDNALAQGKFVSGLDSRAELDAWEADSNGLLRRQFYVAGPYPGEPAELRNAYFGAFEGHQGLQLLISDGADRELGMLPVGPQRRVNDTGPAGP